MNQPYDHIKRAGGGLTNLVRNAARKAVPTLRRSTKATSGLPESLPSRPNTNKDSNYLAWLESQLKPRSGNPYSAGDPNWFVNNYGSNFNISDLTPSGRSSAFTLPSRFNSPASLIDGVIHRGFTTPAQQHRRVYGNEGSDALREFAVRHHMANPESQSLFASAYPDRRWYKPIELLEDPIPQYRRMGYRPKSETLAGFEGGDYYAPFGGGPAIIHPAGLNRYTGSVKSLMGMPSPQDLYKLNAPTALHEAVGHGTQWDELYPNLFDAQRALRARDINGAISPFSPITNYLEEPKPWLETVYGYPGPHRGYTLRPVELHPHVTEMKGVKYLVDGELPLMDTDAKIKQWQTWWQDNLKSQKMESSHTATEHILSPDFYQQRYGAILDLFRQYPDEAANILRGTVKNNLQTNPLDSSIPVSLGDNDKYASLNYNASVNQPYAHIKQASGLGRFFGIGAKKMPDVASKIFGTKAFPFSHQDPFWVRNHYGSDFHMSDITPSRYYTPPSSTSVTYRDTIPESNGTLHYRGVTTPAEQHARFYTPDGSDALRESAVSHHIAYPERQGLWGNVYDNRRWYKYLGKYEQDPNYTFPGHAYMPGVPELRQPPGVVYPSGEDVYTGDVKKLMGIPSADFMPEFKAITSLHEAIGHGTQRDDTLPYFAALQRELRGSANGKSPVFTPSAPMEWPQGEHAIYAMTPKEIYPHITEMKGIKYLRDGELPLMETDAKARQFEEYWRDTLSDLQKQQVKNAPLVFTGNTSDFNDSYNYNFFLQRYGAIMDLFKGYPLEAINLLRSTVKADPQSNPTLPGSASLNDSAKYAAAKKNTVSAKPYEHIKQAGGLANLARKATRSIASGFLDSPAPTSANRALKPPIDSYESYKEVYPYGIMDENWAKIRYGDNPPDLTPFRDARMITPSKAEFPSSDYMFDTHLVPLGHTSPATEHARIYGPERSDILRNHAYQYQRNNPHLQGVFTPTVEDEFWYRPVNVFADKLLGNPFYSRGAAAWYRPHSPLGVAFPGFGTKVESYRKYNPYSSTLTPEEFQRPSILNPILKLWHNGFRTIPLHEATGHGMQQHFTRLDPIYNRRSSIEEDMISDAIHREYGVAFKGRSEPGAYSKPEDEVLKSIIERISGTGYRVPFSVARSFNLDPSAPARKSFYPLNSVEVHPTVMQLKAQKFLTDGKLPIIETAEDLDEFMRFFKPNPLNPFSRKPALIKLFEKYPEEALNLLNSTVKADPQSNSINSIPAGSLSNPAKLASIAGVSFTKQATYWSNDITRDILNNNHYPVNALTGELAELADSVKNLDYENFKEELGDSAFVAQLMASQRLGVNLPVVGVNSTINKFLDRLNLWKKMFNDRGIEFKQDYLKGGSNYSKLSKIQKAFAAANRPITLDEAKAITQKYNIEIEEEPQQ